MIGTALTIGAGIVAPAIATGAEGAPAPGGPVPAAQQQAALHWRLPKVPSLRPLHLHRHGHHATHHHRRTSEHASRSSFRRSLASDPRTAAHALLLRQGWSEGEWTCLDALWTRESHWDPTATNASSGAYGIPQSLPASKMAAAGSDWRTNPLTQIRWGLSYIAAAYGTPCAALAHSSSYGYY